MVGILKGEKRKCLEVLLFSFFLGESRLSIPSDKEMENSQKTAPFLGFYSAVIAS